MRKRTSGVYQYDTAPWRAVIAGTWAAGSAAVAVGSLGMPTGWGVWFGIITAVCLGTIAMALSSAMIALMLALIGVPVPRFTIGGMLYVSAITYRIATEADADIPLSVAITVIIPFTGAVLGWFIWAMFSSRIHRAVKIGLFTLAAGGSAFLIFSLSANSDVQTALGPVGKPFMQISAADPSASGAYKYRYFTYGSGEDKHRPEYGDNVALISDSVDASAYISEWPWLRDMYWGFDERKLPLNGRVWMPKGEGPFPLVLMVHGNHLMEYSSDGGYGYLGQLLASRGMIAVSVDENFLNYSVWSGIPDQDYKVRAWLLLKHLQQIQHFGSDEDTPLYEQVDFGQVALIGHSRGGQAVAMATDWERWFASDDTLPKPDSYTIQAVVALAPTDTAVDDERAELEDVSYLTLQGAHDADVDHFYGASQYARTSFSGPSQRFKAALVIADANHVHFNTAWGDYDLSLPEGLFLNLHDLISEEDQRQIAKVYVSAFLETVFHGQSQYVPLFRDYRTGLQFLPQTRYYNRFENSTFFAIAQFDDDTNSFQLADEITTEARQMKEKMRTKRGEGKVLSWKKAGTYTFKSNEGFFSDRSTDHPSFLTFTLANRGSDGKTDEANIDSQPLVNLEIELVDQAGESVHLPLARFMPVQPVPDTRYTWSHVLEEHIEDGDYAKLDDPVFQTYVIPFQAFQAADPAFSLSQWTELTFHFDGGPGKVIFKNIGTTR